MPVISTRIRVLTIGIPNIFTGIPRFFVGIPRFFVGIPGIILGIPVYPTGIHWHLFPSFTAISLVAFHDLRVLGSITLVLINQAFKQDVLGIIKFIIARQ